MFKFIKFGDGPMAVAIIIGAGILSAIVWNFGWVANVALISVAAKTPQERIALSSSRGTYNRISGIIFSFAGLPFATFLGKIFGVDYQFAALAFILGVGATIGYYFHFRMFEGYEETASEQPVPKNVTVKKEKLGVSGTLKALVSNRPLLILMVAEVARWIVNFVVMAMAVYYFTYVVKNTALLATYLIIINTFTAVGAFSCKFIANKLSARTTTILYFILMGIILIAARVVYQNYVLLIIFMSVAQYLYGSIYSLTPALFADTVIYDEWRTGKNASGWIMGLSVVPLKVALIVRGFIVNGILAAAGFSGAIDPATASESVMSGIGNAFLLIPGVLVLIGGILLAIGYNLTNEKVTAYSAEIATRNQVNAQTTI
jgi:GPH family glycoside/pentoside/hexuronide:cation symporter